MFHNSNFNQDISNWDVSNVQNMYGMFFDAVSFNQSLNDWDVSNVIDMSYMFSGAVSFNQPLDNWDVSNVESMEGMFKNAMSFNSNISTWKTHNLRNTNSMFFDAVSFNQSLNDWDVSNVIDMSYMFSGAVSFNQSLNDWDVSNVIDMSYMFSGAVSFNQPLDNWDVSNVESMEGMFKNAISFNNSLNEWNTASLENIAYMFENATSFNQNLNSWDTSKIRYMINTFKNAINFNGNISNWETNNVINMNGMFFNAVSFNQSLNDWDVSNVTDMCEMFFNAVSFNQPLNKWNTRNVWCVSAMFFNAVSFNQSLDNWDVSNVEDFSYMFACDVEHCNYSFNGDISSWNTSKAADMSAMFFNAVSFNQSLDNWDVSNVESMNSMFFNAVSFNQDISKWNVSSLNDANNMFYNVTLSTDIYDSLLNSWVNLNLKNNVPFDAGNSKYTENATESRKKLITDFNWVISDGGQYMLCIENWIKENVSCNGTISNYILTYFDSNYCNTTINLPPDNGTIINCCVENWSLTSQECINNIFVKKYYDLNNCNTTYTIPLDNGTTQYCIYSKSKSVESSFNNIEKRPEVCIYDENYDWECSEWGECINGKQYRVCLEKNNCGTKHGRPEVEKKCDDKTKDETDIKNNDNIVKKDKALFDIILDVLEEPYENQELPIRITLINFGKPGLINVNLTYFVYDTDQNTVFYDKKEYVVDTQKEFITNIPLNIISGKYHLKVILEYPDQEYPALAQKDFIVKKRFNSYEILLISSVLVALLIFILYISIKFKIRDLVQRILKNVNSRNDFQEYRDISSSSKINDSNLNGSVFESEIKYRPQDKIIIDSPQGKEFFLKDKAIKNLKELLSELYSMDESCFRNYVNEYKNDFANWIRDVFEKRDLAQKIASTRSKDELIAVLKEYV
ncbi:MAG: BspA family leucine-rich repeat surface protein, partial [Candidatus Woesearchaeota archaeon]